MSSDKETKKILFIESDRKAAPTRPEELIQSMRLEGRSVFSAEEAREWFDREFFDAVICVEAVTEERFLPFLRHARSVRPSIPFLLGADLITKEACREVLRQGTNSFIFRPGDRAALAETLERALRLDSARYVKHPANEYRMENVYRATVNSSEANILRLVGTVEHLINLVYSDRVPQMPEVNLALYEVLANACEHGNGYLHERKIDFYVELTMTHITMRVRDEGKGFDRAPVIAAGETSSNIYRGLALVAHCMDALAFNESGNEISLFKVISSTPASRH